MSLCCLFPPWSILYSFIFHVPVSELTEVFQQPDSDFTYKAPDASSASDFYGLFDSPEKPAGRTEEFKVASVSQLAIFQSNLGI